MTKLFQFYPGPWVVTYEIRSPKGLMIAEFYRGSQSECERIEAASSVGEDDQHPTAQPWTAKIGPAAFWEAFIESAIEAGDYIAVRDR